MRILPNNNYNNHYHPSFKQIKPEHMFIKIRGYEADEEWAEGAIQVINYAKTKIQIRTDFREIMAVIARKYGALFDNSFVGMKRIDACGTPIEGKYKLYKKRLMNLVKKEGQKFTKPQVINGYQTLSLHLAKIKSEFGHEIIPMSEIRIYKENIALFPSRGVRVVSPAASSIAPAFREITPIYHRIISNNGRLSAQNIKKITKDVAQIHWLLSQVRPYVRGSAGTADILVKSLFEAKGIQVSPYKKNIDPNLEAFTMPVEKYVEEFENFFSEPLKPIKPD